VARAIFRPQKYTINPGWGFWFDPGPKKAAPEITEAASFFSACLQSTKSDFEDRNFIIH
jgi:hypothetical protein